MICEVLAVGTELLLGPVVNTNSTWIGEQLAAIGIDSYRHVVVGDNHGRIVAAMIDALERADVVLVTGGLGPTQDDITRQAMAEVMGAELIFDQDLLDKIAAMFTARGRVMSANNANQAWRPSGSTALAHQPGTAPGLACPVGNKLVYLMPGVPFEMRAMMEHEVLPALAAASGQSGVIKSRTLRTWGVGESDLAELVADHLIDLETAGNNPTLAFLAKGIEGIHLRVTAKAATEAAAVAMLDREEAALRTLVGPLVFAVDQTMEAVVGELLVGHGLTLATAESLTGGLISTRLTDTPGASAWFRGGVVSYASAVKYDVLEVPPGPVVSTEAAVAMATGVVKLLGADIGLGITGVAGPSEQEGQPVGTVHAALILPGKAPVVKSWHLRGNRQNIREMVCINILDTLRKELL